MSEFVKNVIRIATLVASGLTALISILSQIKF
jgi:hypothetical protein